jgi:cytochrome P450
MDTISPRQHQILALSRQLGSVAVEDLAQRFDVTRDASAQVVFGGGGPHYCLGAFLARMQVETLFTAVLDRGLRFELAGPTARLRSNFGNGFKTMPVRAAQA